MTEDYHQYVKAAQIHSFLNKQPRFTVQAPHHLLPSVFTSKQKYIIFIHEINSTMSYASKTVAQLKELLKAKGLPINGVKLDLVKRLEESEKENGVEESTKEKSAEDSTDEPVEEKKEEPEEKKEEKQEPQEEEKPKEPVAEKTPEELASESIALLEKKIQRAKRFGGDEQVIEDIERQIKRIKKFGVSRDSDIALEVLGKTKPAVVNKSFKKDKGRKPKGNKGGRVEKDRK